MSMNIDQIYIANPSTAAPLTALMYLGLSPFGTGDDSAILVSNFLAQIPGYTVIDVSASPQSLVPGSVYITDNGATLVTYTLPVTAALGTTIEIDGKSAGGWTLAQNAGQVIHIGNQTTTVGVAGSLSSTNQWDSVKLRCVTANTTWSVIGGVGNLTVV
jgi:hypothetical protein